MIEESRMGAWIIIVHPKIILIPVQTDLPGVHTLAQPLLQVEDLRTYFKTPYGISRAVDCVSFSLNAGETLAIVRESGCGKSMTALSILQLVPEPAGYIEGGR